MNRMFRRVCGAFLSCTCVIWHGRLDAKQCSLSGYSGGPCGYGQNVAQDVDMNKEGMGWYVGYAVTGAWMDDLSDTRSLFSSCALAASGHKFTVCSLPAVGAYFDTSLFPVFIQRCLHPYTKYVGNTGAAIPYACMINSTTDHVIYASTPKIFQDYGCTSGFVGGANIPCLYVHSQSGVADITFYPDGQPSGSSSGSGSDDSITGVTVSGMTLPLLGYTFTGCHKQGYWAYTAEMPAHGTSGLLLLHPSMAYSSDVALDVVAESMYQGCKLSDSRIMSDTLGQHLEGGSLVNNTQILGCCYCPSGSSDLANKSTLFGSNAATLNVKEQANRVGIESCSLNSALGTDSNNKGTIRYTNCTSYSQ